MNRLTSTSRRARLVALGTTAALAAGLTLAVAAPAHAAAPAGGADAYSVTQDTPYVLGSPGLFVNDSDAEGDSFGIHSVWPPAGGPLPGEELQVTAGGGFTYFPPAGYAGTRTWQYRLEDAAEVSDYIDIVFTIAAAVNLPPVVVDDQYQTGQDQVLSVPAASGILANDSDPEGDAFELWGVGGNAPVLPGESLNMNYVTGGFIYTPPTGYTGQRSYNYSVTPDGGATFVFGEFTIDILDGPVQTNEAPVAVADSYTTTAGTPLVVAAPGLLANDSDADSATFTVKGYTSPLHGDLVMQPGGAFTYTPAVGYVGADSFTYRLIDETLLESNTVTVSLEIEEAMQVNAAPVATADTYAVTRDMPLVVAAPGVLANDSDADGDTMSVASTWDPIGGLLPGEQLVFGAGDGSFAYTPPTGYTGTRVFGYTAGDGVTEGAPATVTFTITAPSIPTTPTTPTVPGDPNPSTPDGRPENLGGPGSSLAATGDDASGGILAGAVGLLLLALGAVLRRTASRREA